jgi:hypothetical protein
MKKVKSNPVIKYEKIETPNSVEALDIAFNILFEEVMIERKANVEKLNLSI